MEGDNVTNAVLVRTVYNVYNVDTGAAPLYKDCLLSVGCPDLLIVQVTDWVQPLGLEY